MFLKLFTSLLLSLFFALQAQALPLTSHKMELSIAIQPQKDYNFTGIVRLSNCSGSLVRFVSSLPTDKGLVLTNGHCVNLLKPGVVIYHQPVKRMFALLDTTGQETLGYVNSTEILYGTMTNTDMALYSLDSTYEEIYNQFKVTPYVLAPGYVKVGTSIDILSGFWKKGYSCEVESFVYKLKEDAWTWYDSIRYSRPGCETIHGTSGSPVIMSGTRYIVAINNTGNDDGKECTMDNPCEVDPKGNVFYQKGFSYAQQTSWVYTCLSQSGAFDLRVSGCILPKPPAKLH